MMESCCTRPTSAAPSRKLNACVGQADFAWFNDQEGDSYSEVQHHVFSWLNWTPPPGSACYKALYQSFPGALPGPSVHQRIRAILESKHYGFTVENTLFGVSICPDEINNKVGDLADTMKSHWGNIFPLGGISGAPFVGATGFKAFSAHVPDNGDIIILFGPHVGVSSEGEVGKILRDGQHASSTACGAVIGAYNACSSTSSNKQGEEDDFNEIDMQMEWIKAQIAPHVKMIKAQPYPMAALAFQAYEMVKAKLNMIVNTDFGSGRLVLIGGIQINMPSPYKDQFLPLSFDLHQKGQPSRNLLREYMCHPDEPRYTVQRTLPYSKKAWNPDAKSAAKPGSKQKRDSDIARYGSMSSMADYEHLDRSAEDEKLTDQHMVFAWLTWSPELNTPCYRALHKEFPGALPSPGVHHRIEKILTKDYGLTPKDTLFGTSICSDEINNSPDSLTVLMAAYWGAVFPMGGIGGMPFAGKTGFKAFSAHVPIDGNIVILYGPHVAVSESGEVGKYLRKGQQSLSTACGAVIGAYNAACTKKGQEDIEFDETDMQMSWIKSQVAAHAAEIQKQACPLAALAYQAFKLVQTKMDKVVDTEFGRGRLVLIGGIQINMPAPCSDHFLPMSFEVRQAGKPTQVVNDAFHVAMPDEDLDAELTEYVHI